MEQRRTLTASGIAASIVHGHPADAWREVVARHKPPISHVVFPGLQAPTCGPPKKTVISGWYPSWASNPDD